MYGKRVVRCDFPLVSLSTEKGHRNFSVKPVETNSPKQEFPSQLNKKASYIQPKKKLFYWQLTLFLKKIMLSCH